MFSGLLQFSTLVPVGLIVRLDRLFCPFHVGVERPVMVEERATKILRVLESRFDLPSWTNSSRHRDPFETLVVTVISQNTADRNTAKAFENLSKCFKISPETLAKVELTQIEDAIRVAGLYRAKAKTIQQAAIAVLEKYGGALEPILQLPLEKARKTLMDFPGVGPKTADVVLLFSAKQQTVPVDTHVNRVSKRLGLAPQNGEYETVRQNLQAIFDPRDYLAVHLLLIQLGREFCKATRPTCKKCPVNEFCPSNGLWERK